jgi:CheY-like chemotaxis protein
LNLGVNARDALPGGGEIAFSTAIVPIGEEAARAYPFSVAPGIFLKVSVADNGVGMDEKTRARVFEPFFSTKEPGKGTGLGLASVYGTVKNHGGFIEFRSEPGQGTVFDISLPLSDVPEIKSEKEPSATAQPAPEKRPGRILLVDDMPVLREIAGDMLRDLGHTVQVCQDGSEALEWFRANHERCDLVILDLSMPKLGGRDCLRAMNDVKPGIKAIITSGHALDDEITDLLKEGASAFLQKPFENQKLSETVQRALSTEGKTWPAHSN